MYSAIHIATLYGNRDYEWLLLTITVSLENRFRSFNALTLPKNIYIYICVERYNIEIEKCKSFQCIPRVQRNRSYTVHCCTQHAVARKMKTNRIVCHWFETLGRDRARDTKKASISTLCMQNMNCTTETCECECTLHTFHPCTGKARIKSINSNYTQRYSS